VSSRLNELTLGAISLEELVDREALGELVSSFFELFRVPLRVFSQRGLLVEARHEPEIYRYLMTIGAGRDRVYQVIEEVKALEPTLGKDAIYECFTGAAYRISAIGHDERLIGKLVLGPYLPASLKQVPKELLAVAGVDQEKVKELLAAMPRARSSTVAQISQHLQRNLELILFSGHKALLTSSMHLASVRESYRDLEEKNTKLQDAYDQLKELDRLKSNFLATVSHELRTPLTSIIGFSEMLSEGIGGSLTIDQREFVVTIHEKGQHLLELISGLLDLSKLESGTMALHRASVDVAALVKETIVTITPQARRKDIRCATQLEEGLPAIAADPMRLRQVLLNLLDNALKFTPEGGLISVKVETGMLGMSSDEAEGAVLFSGRLPAVRILVADTGLGIPDDEKTKVFDPFYQVDSGSTREVGGTGLGLSIVKRLVDGHHGSVRVQDNRPRGCVFVVELPVGEPPDQP
jgi:two-component system, NarL family, sensor histidine kinase BarA